MRLSANAAIGAGLVGLLALAAIVATVWTPYDPLALSLTQRLRPPSALHWLGTDEFGRDVASRLMAGASAGAGIALMAVAVAVAGGLAIGLVAGFLRGWTDRVLMGLNDALLAFPGVLLALGLTVVMGSGREGVVLALGFAYAPSVARIVRGTVLSIREREFIEAARLCGTAEWRILTAHVMPNALAPVIVLATSMFGWVLLAESSLSFLGLGLPPPSPSWGNMLAASRPYLASAPWLGILPGLCIALTLLGVNLLGDGLRDRLDPRMVRA